MSGTKLCLGSKRQVASFLGLASLAPRSTLGIYAEKSVPLASDVSPGEQERPSPCSLARACGRRDPSLPSRAQDSSRVRTELVSNKIV